jgi:hypothetical protein
MRRLSLLFLAACVAISLIPAPCYSETINACVNNRSGVMRIVVDPAQCRKTERPVSWSTVVGVPGPAGPAGPQGEQGLLGPKGDTGPQGTQGLQGIQGLKGDKGDQGLQGVQGVQGPEGKQGPVGPPSSPTAISVYDANNQNLGVLVRRSRNGINNSWIEIFIPTLNAFTFIEENQGSNVGKIIEQTLYYESNNCSGNPYVDPDNSILDNMIVYNDYSKQYWRTIMLPIPNHAQSYASTESQGCLLLDNPGWFGYPVVEVAVQDFPFSVPISLPLRYESQ